MKDILTVSEHQEIYVSKIRNLEENTISYEDRELLFDIVHLDRDNKKRYIISNKGRNKLKVNSIVGSISLKTGLTIEILPKFAKNNLDEDSIKKYRKMLINILRVSKEKNFISSSSQNSKVLADEMPLLHYVIELFSEELLSVLRSGVYASYNNKIENSSHIKGTILISKTIQNNIIDKSKVYVSYNQHSSNNLLMQVFRTLAKILLNDKNLSYRAKQNLHEVYLLLDNVEIIKIQKYDFKKIIFNRLNDKFETLFTQAEFIFNQYMPFSSSINSTPFWSILFDMNYLFEKFCAYLFRKSNIEIKEQSIINCFTDSYKMVSTKPDFIIQDNTETINVVDAKWKMLDKKESLYGLNAQNFWQLFSYMNLINQDKEIKGYFIVPKYGDSFEDEIIFTPIKDGNKSINILSIDFSLDFEELLNKYSFEMIDNELKLCEKVVAKEPIIEDVKIENEEIEIEDNILADEIRFNFKDFIEELQLFHKNKSLRKKVPNKEDKRFKNLFILKNEFNYKKDFLKESIMENTLKNEWNFSGLDVIEIPMNVVTLKASKLIFKNNNLHELPNNFLKLKNLNALDLSNNKISNLPSEIGKLENLRQLSIDGNNDIDISNILEVKSLKLILVDKNIIENNIEIIKELQSNNVKIQDSDKNDLTDFINSILDIEKDEKENEEDLETIIDLTLENYEDFNDEEKLDFCINVDFISVDKMMIKKLCYESNKDILVEILFNNTVQIRFILLIYILNYYDKEFKKKHIDEKINDINNEELKNIINLAEISAYEASKYIENNFLDIDDEILFGYAMSNIGGITRTREMISKKTNNLYILDELSKNIYDDKVIGNIIFKARKNTEFTNIIKTMDTVYSIKTLNRISKYKQYYKIGDEYCRIIQLASNYSLSNETREYLFNTYKNDLVLLKELNEGTLYSLNPELKEKLKEKLFGYSHSYEDKDEKPINQIEFL